MKQNTDTHPSVNEARSRTRASLHFWNQQGQSQVGSPLDALQAREIQLRQARVLVGECALSRPCSPSPPD
jgi:hypothetical protein